MVSAFPSDFRLSATPRSNETAWLPAAMAEVMAIGSMRVRAPTDQSHSRPTATANDMAPSRHFFLIGSNHGLHVGEMQEDVRTCSGVPRAAGRWNCNRQNCAVRPNDKQ